MKILTKYLVLSILCFTSSLTSGSPTIIHIKPRLTDKDHRQVFVHEVIKAVLDETIKTDGPYKLAAATNMNVDRAEKLRSRYPNLVVRLSGNIQREEHWHMIPIPINKGIVGYRIFLIRKDDQPKFSKISTLQDLIASGLIAGQGRTWDDVAILRKSKLETVDGGQYNGLFRMLMLGRFDYFPRGINEAFEEVEARRDDFPGLAVEQNLVIYYPLPRVLATFKGNHKLASRIERGLEAIFDNGVHEKIWLKHHKKWLDMANLRQRTIIAIKNPFALSNLPYNEDKYWHYPKQKLPPTDQD